jgi:hypothetical protein
MFLNFLLLIDFLTVWVSSYHLKPSTVFFVCFFRRVPTAATKRIVFHFYSLFGFNESLPDFFSTENISIEMFTEYLCGFILDSVFGFDCNDVIDSHLIKSSSNFLRIARVYEDHFGKKLYTTTESLYDFICLNDLESA